MISYYRLFRHVRGLRWAAALLCASLVGTGCQTLREDRFVVRGSSLDYLQIVRTHIPHGSERPETLRLDLTGSGYLQLTAGRSERVRTGFWQEAETPDWSDWRRDYVVLSQPRTLAYFQAFVNAGLFDRPPRRQPEEEPDLAILMATGSRKNMILTAEPVYHQLFAELLAEF